MQHTLTPAQKHALSLLQIRGEIVWETGVPADVRRPSLDALVRTGHAVVETSSTRVPGERRGQYGWRKGFRSNTRIYRLSGGENSLK